MTRGSEAKDIINELLSLDDRSFSLKYKINGTEDSKSFHIGDKQNTMEKLAEILERLNYEMKTKILRRV